MKVLIHTTTTVTVQLSEAETKWLHAVMQNPLQPDPRLDHESPVDKEMRRKFWDATTTI